MTQPEKTVLIIEDEPDAAEMFAEMMRVSGFRVIKSLSSTPAISLMASEKPDVVILDVMMPDISGLDVLRLMRQEPKLAKIPVVVVSAKGMPSDIKTGLEAPPGLGKLQHSIDAATNRLGYSSDDKPFSGHLTIGRVRQQSSSAEMAGLRSALEKTKVGLMGTFSAKSVHLFRSDLQPDGPIYTCLFTAALGGRPFTR